MCLFRHNLNKERGETSQIYCYIHRISAPCSVIILECFICPPANDDLSSSYLSHEDDYIIVKTCRLSYWLSKKTALLIT
jgi:hypothetical protein